MLKEETVTVDPLRRAVPAKYTDEGLRALSRESPIRPESVQKYLEGKFGDALEDVSNAMLELAKSLPPPQLAGKAYALYEKFRPEIPPGKKGWGVSGKLDLDLIRKMASESINLRFESLTGALPDRLTHRCHILEANGESYRLRQARKRSNLKPLSRQDSNPKEKDK